MSGKHNSYVQPAIPATEYHSWTWNVGGPLTIDRLQRFLMAAASDNVPVHANVQLSGPALIAHWRHEVEP